MVAVSCWQFVVACNLVKRNCDSNYILNYRYKVFIKTIMKQLFQLFHCCSNTITISCNVLHFDCLRICTFHIDKENCTCTVISWFSSVFALSYAHTTHRV